VPPTNDDSNSPVHIEGRLSENAFPSTDSIMALQRGADISAGKKQIPPKLLTRMYLRTYQIE
jgi:hypothetical protein